jgi:peptidoglycan hydrolase-like protein with peptidoglycan-binding domain
VRVFIVAMLALVILGGADASKAGLILATRDVSASVDPATFTDESNQTTEDQIGLNKGQRRDVQRRLNSLGFDTKATGKFDENARAAIIRWQSAHGYGATGFLNKVQRDALLAESVAAAHASTGDETDNDRPPHARRHRVGGGGGPVGLIGGVVGGLFGRR